MSDEFVSFDTFKSKSYETTIYFWTKLVSLKSLPSDFYLELSAEIDLELPANYFLELDYSLAFTYILALEEVYCFESVYFALSGPYSISEPESG